MLGLLNGVTWHGRPLTGRRTHALLAVLAVAEGRAVTDQTLVAAVWADDNAPANPAKALQVVVSRTRSATDATVVARTEQGYRLGLAVGDVDALLLQDRVRAASRAEAGGDLAAARDLARTALVLGAPLDDVGAHGPLRDLRVDAEHQRAVGTAVLGRALSGLGEHDEALALLQDATVDDEPSALALLRSLAAVRGAPAALERYEQLRVGLAERLGVDPGPALRAVYAELLAADHPVRSGLRYDAASLVGREEDLRALRALVRRSRVVSILGPGGLGKTRLANLLAAEAEQSVVHVVELVGVSVPDDVVGEVGSALGVRDSVAGRRALTPDQRHDVRVRIAQSLEQAPTLLVLDNCEHVVAAVADLVAYLVATVRHLRVVTTTRAPLAIAAEQVFALDQLGEEAAVDLFSQRARAARPAVGLDQSPVGAVRRVVRRLDGLPLAIELAAAKARVMSVEDIDRRLDDRFALLRGGDRSAPDRHQTLIAVIDWSWNLLTELQRRALRWLSVFHDGFTLAGAEALLGADPLDAVQALVDQSLLTVLETDVGVRFRMLETVREFGRMQLVGAGEDDAARTAQVAWARAFAEDARIGLWGRDQVEVVAGVVAEENNLIDCLRAALAAGDPGTVAALIGALGSTWTIRGENIRVVVVSQAVDAALAGWSPRPAEVDSAARAAAVVVLTTIIGAIPDTPACLALLHALLDAVTDRQTRGFVEVVLAQDTDDVDAVVGALDEIADRCEVEDSGTAAMARIWAAHHRENAGDLLGALTETERGLAVLEDDEPPWLWARLQAGAAALNAHAGRHDRSAEHAAAALPLLVRLQADDDIAEVHALSAYAALAAGRLDEAERMIDEIERSIRPQAIFGGEFLLRICRAELSLARGDIATGLQSYRDARTYMDRIEVPVIEIASNAAPWVLFAEGTAVTAFARFARSGPDDGHDDGHDLYVGLAAKLPEVLRADRPHLDFPVVGLVLHALGAYELLRSAVASPRPTDVEPAVRRVVLGDLLACSRALPVLDLAEVVAAAQARAAGLITRVRAEYDGLRGPDLLAAAAALPAPG